MLNLIENQLQKNFRLITQVISKYRFSFVTSILIILIIFGVWAAYLIFEKQYVIPSWLGIDAYRGTLQQADRGKTLWDWMELLIVPILITGGALWFNQQQQNRAINIENDRQREETLQNYLETMSILLMDKGLRASKEKDVIRDVARSRTLTTLRMLDPTRKGFLIRFLYEADLIKNEYHNIHVNLIGADLIEADLYGAELPNAYLRNVFLNRAVLHFANLCGADLQMAKLRRARMCYTDLKGANLSGAKLHRADLSHADLVNANLKDAILDGTKFVDALYNQETIWPDGFNVKASGAKLVAS